MRPIENIWLTEYEGLLPMQPSDADVATNGATDADRSTPEPISRHPQLAMVEVERTTPLAIFE